MSEPDANPYLGPRPYERADRPLFFGRDPEIYQLLSLVVAHRVVLLYAPSGAGKTSLLNAGLLPLLEEDEGFEVFPAARVAGAAIAGDVANPFVHNVVASWRRDLGASDGGDATFAGFLGARAHPVDADGFPAPRLVVFDQFEEIFTMYQEHWRLRDPLFVQLAEALDEDPLLRVVIAIREDYLAQLDRYAQFLPNRIRTRLRIERLSGPSALAAVTQPVAQTRRRYAPGVAEELVGDLLKVRVDTGGVVVEVEGEYAEPVQLQVACRSLWDALPPEIDEITADHLTTFGDVDEVLAAFYAEAIGEAAVAGAVPERDVRADLERLFITSGGTRGTVYAAAGAAGVLPEASLAELERRHLIRAEFRAGARWLELTHDRLIEPIRASNRSYFGKLQRRRRRRLTLAIPIVGVAAAAVTAVALSLVWPSPKPGPLSTEGAALICRFEGMRLHAYKDVLGNPTIGCSHLITDPEKRSGILLIAGSAVPWARGITPKQASQLMAQDVQPVRKEIERAVTVPLNTHQLDALTSFVFNSGLGSFKQSHLLRDLNAGRYHAVPSDLMAWTKAGGQTLSGLVKRRRAEGALWNGESQSGSK